MTRNTKTALLNFITAIIWTFIAVVNRYMYNLAVSLDVKPTWFVWFFSHVGIYVAFFSWVIAILGGVGWVKQLPGKKG